MSQSNITNPCNPLYFITVVQTDIIDDEEQYTYSTCCGYYYELSEATNVVLENHGNIYEGTHNYEFTYNYIVIETVPCGIFPTRTKEVEWFRWNNNDKKYENITKPKFSKYIKGWAM